MARAAPAASAPRGPREPGQKMKTLKDLCRSPNSDTGVTQPLVSRSADTHAVQRVANAFRAGRGVERTHAAGTAGQRKSSPDTAAEAAAKTLVAASKRRRLEVKPASSEDERQQDALEPPSDADVGTGTLLSRKRGDAAPLTAHGKRQRGSAVSKEVLLLASKVVVTPGQTRTRRNAADQAWWVVR